VIDLYSLGQYFADWGYNRVERVEEGAIAAVDDDHVLLVKRVDADDAEEWLDAGDES